MKRRDHTRNSGQILVISVLVVSLVLLSTQLYIYEIGRSLETQSIRVNDFILAMKLGSRHVVTGSLASISAGGVNSTLSTNLERWGSFAGNFYQFGKPTLNSSLPSVPPYTNGTYLSWGTDGFGVSSACVDFSFSLTDRQVTAQLPYTVNITTSLRVEGVFRRTQGAFKQVNVTINLSNEGDPALARNLTVLYESQGWFVPDFQNTDYGNGTYVASFEADFPGNEVYVSAQVYDLREVYVQANATCIDVT